MRNSSINLKFFLTTFFIAFLYISLNIYTTNYQVINLSFLGDFSATYRFTLISALFQGLLTSMSISSLIFLITIAIFTGANFALIIRNKNLFAFQRKTNLVMGGGTILGSIGSGCASCGLPLLGFLGMSGSVSYLPFKGLEFSILAVMLLLISFFVLLRNSNKVCKL